MRDNATRSDPIAFLINLDVRPDRLEQARSQLDREGVTFRRFPALTQASALEAGFSVCTPAEEADWLRVTPGNLGCAASHLSIYRLIVNEGLPGAIILEDDIVLAERFGDRLRRAFDRSPEVHLLQLGAVQQKQRIRGRLLDSVRSMAGASERDRLTLGSFGYGTHCYWVSQEFAAAALKLFDPVFAPIDIMLRALTQFGSWRCAVHWPSLAAQTVGDSDIRPDYFPPVAQRPQP